VKVAGQKAFTIWSTNRHQLLVVEQNGGPRFPHVAKAVKACFGRPISLRGGTGRCKQLLKESRQQRFNLVLVLPVGTFGADAAHVLYDLVEFGRQIGRGGSTGIGLAVSVQHRLELIKGIRSSVTAQLLEQIGVA